MGAGPGIVRRIPVTVPISNPEDISGLRRLGCSLRVSFARGR